MPNNGLIFSTDSLEYRLESHLVSATGSGSGTLAKGHTATAYTEYVPNSVNVLQGIFLQVSSSDDGAGTTSWQAKYDGVGAPAGGYIVGAPAFRNTVEIVVRLRGLKIYTKLTGSLFRVVWNTTEIWVNGAISTVLTGTDVTSNGVGPNYINFIGAPLYATGSVSASKVFTPPTYDPCNPGNLAYMVQASAASTIQAGWRFKDQDGNWVALDCDTWSNSIPGSMLCPFNLNFSNEVTVTDTYSIEIHSFTYSKTQVTYDGRRNLQQRKVVTCIDPDGNEIIVYDEIENPQCVDPCNPEGPLVNGYVDAYYTEVWNESHGGSARAIPNLERSIVRLNNNYKALWRRFHFPEVRGSATRSCTDGAVTVTTGGETTVYPDLGNDFLEVVTNATSLVEECFPAHIYTERTMSKSQSYVKSWLYEGATICECDIPPGVSCPPPPPVYVGYVTCTIVPYTDPGVNQLETIGIQFPSYVGTLNTYQGHLDKMMRYLGSWVNPQWALAYHKDNWEVDGSPQDYDQYWSSIKEQYLYNASLPSNPRTRNSMIASPMYWDNGNQPFQDAFFGGFRWIGVGRFKILSASLPNSITLSSTRSGSWSSDNCSVSVGAGGLTVSGFSGTPAYIELDLANYSVDPYLLLLKAYEIQVSWNTSNVANIDISFIGADNVSSYIGNAQALYPLPAGLQNKYAGSWGIDNGAGVILDIGYDQLSSGESFTAMSDNQRVAGFQLGKAKQFAKLRFTITPTNPANPVTIYFPTFNLNHTHPMLYWENSKALSMLWHNSSGIRWGNMRWYDTILGFQNPPLIDGMGTASTIIDAMAYRYRILLGTGGTNLASTITTDLSSLYDSYEGQSISVVDKFSCSFILPKGNGNDVRYALVNSFSEIPPLACFPYRKRNTNTWLPTGDYAQTVYDWVQDGRYLISTNNAPARLQTDSGVDSGAFLSPGEPGWSIWAFNPVLDNTEDNWRITSGNTVYAKVRPFHGWFTVLRFCKCNSSLDVDLASNLHIHAIALPNGDVQIRKADNGINFTTVNTLSINATSIHIAIDRQSSTQKLYLVAEINNQIKLYTATHPEGTFTLARTIANGSKPIIVIGRDGNRYIYWLDGVAIKGEKTDRADTVLSSGFTVVNSGVDDECLAADEDVYSGGNRRLILIDVEAGSLTQRESLDGENFS